MATVLEQCSRSVRLEDPETALSNSREHEVKELHLQRHDISTPLAGPQLAPRVRSKTDRRREVRYRTNQAGTLTEINPVTFGTTPVRVKDVSRGGLKVCLCRLLYPGATVHVRVGKIVVVAEVRYCVQVTETYVAGLAIVDVIPCEDRTVLFDAISSWGVPDAD